MGTKVLCAMVLACAGAVALAGCRVPNDSRAPARRGQNDPGASSFAFFGGLKAFFVDDAPPAEKTRSVSEADLTRVDEVAPVASPSETATGIR